MGYERISDIAQCSPIQRIARHFQTRHANTQIFLVTENRVYICKIYHSTLIKPVIVNVHYLFLLN